jgi:hypothetical protein
MPMMPSRRPALHRFSHQVWAVMASCFCACATTAPRFPDEVAATFAEDEMRHLVTADVEVYYPKEHRAAAERVAARAAECVRELRTKQLHSSDRGRAILFLTSANFNNAYVGGQAAGEPLHSVNPLSVTSEIFHWFGLSAANTGDIACHEMFHYAHFEQVDGFWGFVHAVIGPVLPTQMYLERWFTEGAAQYYEGRLHRQVGRPSSPVYRGVFESFVAARGGKIGAGELSVAQRELSPFSGAYLTSLPFIEWLVATYGEEKLWQLMDLQGRSIFSPLGATLRFKRVYGLSVGALLDVWEEHLQKTLVQRSRPTSQSVVRADLGQLARMAAHQATGTIALVTAGNEEPSTLRILRRDGSVRAERRLTRFGTDREWIFAGPGSVSGLSFTEDGRYLFLMNDDLIPRGDSRSQVWKVDVETGETLKVWQNVGRRMGGEVSPDGRTFLSVDLSPGRARIIERDLESATDTVLLEASDGVSISNPTWSRDRSRLVFARLDAVGWNLVLRNSDGTARALTTDGAFNYAPRWKDDTHVVFVRTFEGRLQVHELDVDSGGLRRVSDAPWTVVDPAPFGDDVLFVNREGTWWSLDRAPVREAVVVAEAVAVADLPSPESAGGVAVPSPKFDIQRDEAYSPFDHLFVPQMRTPGVLFSVSQDAKGTLSIPTTFTASLAGRDRLGKHNWALNGSLTVPSLESSVNVSYRNLQLAPWAVVLSAAREGLKDQAFWTGTLSAERTVFTTPVSLGFRSEIWQPFGFQLRKFFGPNFSVSYGASEATSYGGTQRQLAFSLDASAYPRAFGSDRDLLDVRLGVGLAAALPFSTRHSFGVSLVGRALPGAPPETLRIGGTSRGSPFFLFPGREVGAGPKIFLPGPFLEAVRGYDDFAVRATAAALATARYRYAFIIDKGFASTFYILPSIFFRQVDVELFASAALTDNAGAQWARAAGAAVLLKTLFASLVGVSLYYQFAYRFDFGLTPLHVVGVSFE